MSESCATDRPLQGFSAPMRFRARAAYVIVPEMEPTQRPPTSNSEVRVALDSRSTFDTSVHLLHRSTTTAGSSTASTSRPNTATELPVHSQLAARPPLVSRSPPIQSLSDPLPLFLRRPHPVVGPPTRTCPALWSAAGKVLGAV